MKFTCSLCSSAAHLKFDYRGFCTHLRQFHAHQPGFKVPCRINGCQRSYTNLRSYQNHVSNVHNWVKDVEPMMFDDTEEESLPDRSHDDSQCNDENHDEISADYHVVDSVNPKSSDKAPYYSQEMLQKSAAIFLIGLKEKHKLTQTAIQGIVDGFTNVSQHQIGSLQSQVLCCDNKSNFFTHYT